MVRNIFFVIFKISKPVTILSKKDVSLLFVADCKSLWNELTNAVTLRTISLRSDATGFTILNDWLIWKDLIFSGV